MNKIELRKTSELTPLDKNPRKIGKTEFANLKASIQNDPTYLQSRAILCYPEDGKLIIYGGNQRYKACVELKIKEVPVIIDYEATPETIKNRIIKDNVESGTWDTDILIENWSIDELEVFKGLDSNLDISIKGFDDIDFDNIHGNEDREKKFNKITTVCPHCGESFEIQV